MLESSDVLTAMANYQRDSSQLVATSLYRSFEFSRAAMSEWVLKKRLTLVSSLISYYFSVSHPPWTLDTNLSIHSYPPFKNTHFHPFLKEHSFSILKSRCFHAVVLNPMPSCTTTAILATRWLLDLALLDLTQQCTSPPPLQFQVCDGICCIDYPFP